MSIEESVKSAASELEIIIPEESESLIRQLITERIRELIHSDFQKLVNILYRLDVSETRLKQLLEENPESDAGVIITEMIIERQAQKIAFRRSQVQNDKNDIPEEDRW